MTWFAGLMLFLCLLEFPAPGQETARQTLVESGPFFKIYDPSVGESNKWYISRAGWGRGGLYLASLIWKDGWSDGK